MRLGRITAVYFLSRVIGSVFGFVAMVYFARRLGETVVGQYSLSLAVVMWAAIIGKVGVAAGIKKRISEQRDAEQFLGAAILIFISMSILIAGLIFILSSYVNNYVGGQVANIIIVLLFAVMYGSLVSTSLQGNHRVHFEASIAAFRQFLAAGAQILFVVLGFGLSGLLSGYAIGYAVAATTGLLALGLRPALPNRRHLASIVSYARYAWLGSVQWRTFNGFDVAMLGLFVSPALVGIYSVAWLCGQFLNFFSRAIAATLFPTMSERASQEKRENITKLVETGLAYAGLLLLPGFVGSVLIGDRLLAVFGDSFVKGNIVLTILIAALVIYAYLSQLLNALNAIDRPDLAFRANGVLIAANMLLNVLLIWQFGWLGAATATAASAAIAFTVAFYYVGQHIDFKLPKRRISMQLVAALCMGGGLSVIQVVVDGYTAALPPELTTVSLIGSGAVLYFSSLLFLSPQFRITVLQNIEDVN